MLRLIVSIAGKPGLFKIVTQGKNVLLVEDVTSGKRFPAHSRDKIISLGDISMYTDSGDKPLGEILDLVYSHEDGKTIDIKQIQAKKAFKELFGEILPDFDRDRVYDSDIKKLFSWYNILVGAGFTSFTKDENESEESEEKASNNAVEKTED